MTINRKNLVQRRHLRIRKKVTGTAERPRLAVFRSNQHIYAQLIDDVAQHTLASASTLDKELQEKLGSTSNRDASAEVGKLVAQRALSKGIEKVVFDRGGNLYHGRVKALADAARETGLNF
ncbi:LSU ribosomal protein L18 RplR [Cyanobacterium sp. HL-69]|uniref:50S ribosomal protein L18 n=1 Tax=Cyanobacterium sp. HL-69 TaxID=2054282 RepID=UPI000CA0F321|nr:LSU ribosomal protein L18 RplR [Cyanobacterium sp. HL-69]